MSHHFILTRITLQMKRTCPCTVVVFPCGNNMTSHDAMCPTFKVKFQNERYIFQHCILNSITYLSLISLIVCPFVYFSSPFFLQNLSVFLSFFCSFLFLTSTRCLIQYQTLSWTQNLCWIPPSFSFVSSRLFMP